MAEQTKNKSAKSNGASKRMGNLKRKDRRQASWRRAGESKAAHREAQDRRQRANNHRRVVGDPLPWEIAQQARRERRATDPKVARRRLEYTHG